METKLDAIKKIQRSREEALAAKLGLPDANERAQAAKEHPRFRKEKLTKGEIRWKFVTTLFERVCDRSLEDAEGFLEAFSLEVRPAGTILELLRQYQNWIYFREKLYSKLNPEPDFGNRIFEFSGKSSHFLSLIGPMSTHSGHNRPAWFGVVELSDTPNEADFDICEHQKAEPYNVDEMATFLLALLAKRTKTASKRVVTDYQQHRFKLFERQDGICNGCKEKFPERNFTVDHIVPLKEGGSDNIENLQLLCSACNSIKGERSMEYLFERLAQHNMDAY